VCNDTLIEWMFCLCTDRQLLRFVLACVQEVTCWRHRLLMCSYVLIEVCCCLCVQGDIYWGNFVAYVQTFLYWAVLLLMCNDTLIEWMFCLCANRVLLNLSLACVQGSNYWHIWLLVCISTIIELLFCLCADLLLLIYVYGGLRGRKAPSVGMDSPLTFKYFFVKISLNGSHWRSKRHRDALVKARVCEVRLCSIQQPHKGTLWISIRARGGSHP